MLTYGQKRQLDDVLGRDPKQIQETLEEFFPGSALVSIKRN